MLSCIIGLLSLLPFALQYMFFNICCGDICCFFLPLLSMANQVLCRCTFREIQIGTMRTKIEIAANRSGKSDGGQHVHLTSEARDSVLQKVFSCEACRAMAASPTRKHVSSD